MHVDGSCHCAAIRFEAEIDPQRVVICHCSDCQCFSGSAFRTSVLVPEADFSMQAGSPAIYEKTAESGSARQLAFCARCGTHLYGTSEGQGSRFFSVRVGTLAQRAELPPRLQVWCRSALSWIDSLSDLRRVGTQ